MSAKETIGVQNDILDVSVTRLDGVLDSLGDFSGSVCQCRPGHMAR